MLATSLLYIFPLCIVAGFIQRTTGFGFGIFIMTMLPMLLPSYAEATTLSGLLALTTNLLITIRLRRHIDWVQLRPVLFTFIVVSAFAISCLSRIDSLWLYKTLGILLIICALYFAFFHHRIRLHANRRMQISMGTLSGLMGGFFAMQGPPAVLYFITAEPSKEKYMATISAYFFIGNLAMTAFRAGSGYLTTAVLNGFLYGIGGVILGTLIGAQVFKHIPEQKFRYVVYSYIGLCGIYFCLR
jgi:uncharacterized membrane protein YfcA